VERGPALGAGGPCARRPARLGYPRSHHGVPKDAGEPCPRARSVAADGVSRCVQSRRVANDPRGPNLPRRPSGAFLERSARFGGPPARDFGRSAGSWTAFAAAQSTEYGRNSPIAPAPDAPRARRRVGGARRRPRGARRWASAAIARLSGRQRSLDSAVRARPAPGGSSVTAVSSCRARTFFMVVSLFCCERYNPSPGLSMAEDTAVTRRLVRRVTRRRCPPGIDWRLGGSNPSNTRHDAECDEWTNRHHARAAALPAIVSSGRHPRPVRAAVRGVTVWRPRCISTRLLIRLSAGPAARARAASRVWTRHTTVAMTSARITLAVPGRITFAVPGRSLSPPPGGSHRAARYTPGRDELVDVLPSVPPPAGKRRARRLVLTRGRAWSRGAQVRCRAHRSDVAWRCFVERHVARWHVAAKTTSSLLVFVT